jgi:hypothetical protein
MGVYDVVNLILLFVGVEDEGDDEDGEYRLRNR